MSSLTAFCQLYPPDYKKIKKNISNKESHLYYPKLLERYWAGDSTMTDEECQHLYYGFTLQDNYHPYSVEDKELNEYLKSKPGLNDSECQEAIVLAKKVLKENPFNVGAINALIYCYEQLDSMALVNKGDQQLRIIAVAIIKSGNGKSAKEAFHVIEVSHEYYLLSLFELFPEGQSLVAEKRSHFDIIQVSENKYGLKEIYFNIDAFYDKQY